MTQRLLSGAHGGERSRDLPHRVTSDTTSPRTLLLLARLALRITPCGVMTQHHGNRILRESFRALMHSNEAEQRVDR